MDKDIKKLFDNIEKKLQEANAQRKEAKEAMEIRGEEWFGRLAKLDKGLSKKSREHIVLKDAFQSFKVIIDDLDDQDKEGLRSLLQSANELNSTPNTSSFALDLLGSVGTGRRLLLNSSDYDRMGEYSKTYTEQCIR